MSKEQTAVECFFRELENVNGYSDFYTNNYQHIDALYNKAKEMEALQIVEAHGSKLKLSRGTSNYEYWYTGMEYYNDKFNNLKCIENE
jgi:hypothetical protein